MELLQADAPLPPKIDSLSSLPFLQQSTLPQNFKIPKVHPVFLVYSQSLLERRQGHPEGPHHPHDTLHPHPHLPLLLIRLASSIPLLSSPFRWLLRPYPAPHEQADHQKEPDPLPGPSSAEHSHRPAGHLPAQEESIRLEQKVCLTSFPEQKMMFRSSGGSSSSYLASLSSIPLPKGPEPRERSNFSDRSSFPSRWSRPSQQVSSYAQPPVHSHSSVHSQPPPRLVCDQSSASLSRLDLLLRMLYK